MWASESSVHITSPNTLSAYYARSTRHRSRLLHALPQDERRPPIDDNSDNRDDSCFIDDAIYRVKLAQSCLVTASACAWQCGARTGRPERRHRHIRRRSVASLKMLRQSVFGDQFGTTRY